MAHLIDAIRREVSRALARLGLRVELVTDLAAGSDGRATGKGLTDDDVPSELARHYGFYGYPPDGASGIVIGVKGLSILLCYRHPQYEPSLQKGEAAMATMAGAKILLDKNGSVLITLPNGQAINLGGGATQPAVLGTALESRLAALEAAYDGHKHVVTGTCPSGGGALSAGLATAPAGGDVVPSPGPNIRSNTVVVAP